MPEWLKTTGWGLLAIVAYVVVSNTIYLLVGSRLLQALPGVNVRGARGTFKIAVWVVLAAAGVGMWLLRLLPGAFGLVKAPTLPESVSRAIKGGAGVACRFDNR